MLPLLQQFRLSKRLQWKSQNKGFSEDGFLTLFLILLLRIHNAARRIELFRSLLAVLRAGLLQLFQFDLLVINFPIKFICRVSLLFFPCVVLKVS